MDEKPILMGIIGILCHNLNNCLSVVYTLLAKIRKRYVVVILAANDITHKLFKMDRLLKSVLPTGILV